MAASAYCAPKTPLTCACPSTATTCSYSSPSTHTPLFLRRPPRSRRDRTGSLFAASSRRDSSDRSKGTKTISCASSHNSSLVTAATWKVSVLNSKLPVVVEFFAAWCGPCLTVDRVIDEIAEEYAGRIRCFKLNADHYPQLAMDHGIERVPTVLIFSNGQRLQSITGTMPKSVYTGAIEKTLE